MEHDDWIDGMDRENVEFSKLEIAGDEQTLTEKLEDLRQHIAENIEADPRAGTEAFELSESDEAASAIPEMAHMAAESGVEWTRGHVGGWVDDSLALARPWGFDLRQIKVPVLLRYGLADVFVPPGHGRWLASQIPGCEVVIENEAGHYAQDPARTAAENLDWLRRRVEAEFRNDA